MRVRKNVLTGIVVGGMIFSAGVLHAQVATPRPTDSSAAEPGSEPGTSDMSEVVVTGTYIRQPGFAQSSPVDVISQEAISSANAVDPAHLFADLPEVSGSAFNTGTAQAASSGGSNINLRGLGAAATLVLIDGKRETQFPSAPNNIVDVDTLIPQIMIGRIDILKDGASALYGTDAVGGVVNFVTRDRFNGVELSAEGSRLTQVGNGGYSFQGLIGSGDDKSHLVAGFEFSHVDPVGYQQLDGSRNFAYGTTSTFNYNVPTASGVKILPDPNCGKVPEARFAGPLCSDYFWPTATAVGDEDRLVIYTVGNRELSDFVTLRAEAGYAHDVIADSSAAAAPLAQAVTVPANNPGNPFGEAVTTTTRIIGSQGGLPTGGTVPEGQFELNRPGFSTNDVYRAGATLSGDVSGWTWNIGGAYSNFRNDTDGADQDVNVPNLVRALNGLGGPNCNLITGVAGKGSCSYFNPFLGSAFAAPGSAAANTSQLVNWIMPPEYNVFTSSLWQVDAIVSGSLFALPAGPLGVAVGAQWRRSTQAAIYDPTLAAGESETFVPSFDFSAARDTKAAFIELNAPILDANFGKLDIDGAARYETSGGPLKSTDPKIGLTFTAPNEFAIARASWGKSFLAPSLFQEFSSTAGTGAVTDPATGALLRPTVITTGNANLKPQTANSYSIGLEIRPINALSLGATYWHINFSDLIATQNPQQLINQNPTSPEITRDPVSGLPTIIAVSYFNASSVVTSGFDLDAAYKLETDRWGRFSFVAAATHVGQYELQASPGGPVIDGTDNYNGTTFASPSMSWRASGRVTWQVVDNTVTAAVHYRSPFFNDAHFGTFSPNIPSFTTFDAAYTYTLRADTLHMMAGNSIALTAGATNLFNAVPAGGTFAYFFGTIDDFRGRILYLKATASF
jgi:iron complex outermembrane recepter protein